MDMRNNMNKTVLHRPHHERFSRRPTIKNNGRQNIEGTGGGTAKKKSWIDDIFGWTNTTAMEPLKRVAENRQNLRKITV